jgi:MarR family transcriptional regulator, 2-MHQ and catechol-resistance regulon repressor
MSQSSSQLQAEIKKRRPFESPAQEAWLNLVRSSSQLQIHFDRLFATFGLTSSQYNILRILRGEGQPLPILEIASRMIAVVPGITGLIDRLEKAGQVRRDRSVDDRRVIFVTITESALATLAQIDQPLKELHDTVMQPLSRDEQRQLVRLLEKLRTGFITF